MIEIQELRIGNIFNDEDGTPCYFAGAWERTDGWVVRDSAGNTYKPAHIYPIPLTPEILEKSGFLFSRDKGVYRKDFGWHTFEFDSNIIFILGGISMPHIASVHQLQNLYFSLTNTELTVNL